MKWTDIQQIAELLYEQNPDEDPTYIRFTDLHQRIMALPGFDDLSERSNERILESIQQAWLDER